jgi:hypothetical protein
MRITTSPFNFRRLGIAAAVLSVITACAIVPLQVDTKATAPKLDGFGAATLQPSQISPAAQALFAQGMAQVYAFNSAEAIRAFKAALAVDPECAMCAWGVAYQMGPNINWVKREDIKVAMQYVDYALKRSATLSARDRDLINSLALRYGHSSVEKEIAPLKGEMCRTGSGEPADPLDLVYADHMRQLADRYPNDPDVLAIYVEAEMVATRADWWDRKTGKPAGRIGELATRIEASLAQHPDHVGLNHYMIHSVDSANVASRAVPAADRLGKLAPKSPHLLHMPSHTYAHVGRYADATRVNQLAVAADEEQLKTLAEQKFAPNRDWRYHNRHFQWYGAIMEGRGDLALSTARAGAAHIKTDHEYGEYMRSLPMLTLLHLQRWDAMASEPLAKGELGMAAVLGEMGRGMASVNKGQLADAKAALSRLDVALAKQMKKYPNNKGFGRLARSVAVSSQLQLKAAIAQAEQHDAEALALQVKAVAAADDAEQSEPPMLAGGPRLRLAAMQMKQKQAAAAEASYRAELAVHANSGWALHGLSEALEAQGKRGEMQETRKVLKLSWATADAELRGF